MAKAKRQIKEALPQIDVVIELMDARLPSTSSNPLLAELRGDKPCLKLITKIDLADPDITDKWVPVMQQEQGVKVHPVCIHDKHLITMVPQICKSLAPHRVEKRKAVRALIAGIPNVGKSTLINKLAGKKVARTGNEPAVTRDQQRVFVDDLFWVFDTPGLLWPAQKDVHAGYRLAAISAIRNTAYDHEDVALYAVDYVAQRYPELLKARYDLDELSSTPVELLTQIASRRGALSRGGYDAHKVSELLLNDIRSGAIGRMSFEEPDHFTGSRYILEDS